MGSTVLTLEYPPFVGGDQSRLGISKRWRNRWWKSCIEKEIIIRFTSKNGSICGTRKKRRQWKNKAQLMRLLDKKEKLQLVKYFMPKASESVPGRSVIKLTTWTWKGKTKGNNERALPKPVESRALLKKLQPNAPDEFSNWIPEIWVWLDLRVWDNQTGSIL